jgi:hypothetical protein
VADDGEITRAGGDGSGAMSSLYARIIRCGLRFRFHCPQKWDKLDPTGHPRIRNCRVCRCHVHYCATARDALRQARQGRCIALADREPEPGHDGDPESGVQLTFGMPHLEFGLAWLPFAAIVWAVGIVLMSCVSHPTLRGFIAGTCAVISLGPAVVVGIDYYLLGREVRAEEGLQRLLELDRSACRGTGAGGDGPAPDAPRPIRPTAGPGVDPLWDRALDGRWRRFRTACGVARRAAPGPAPGRDRRPSVLGTGSCPRGAAVGTGSTVPIGAVREEGTSSATIAATTPTRPRPRMPTITPGARPPSVDRPLCPAPGRNIVVIIGRSTPASSTGVSRTSPAPGPSRRRSPAC